MAETIKLLLLELERSQFCFAAAVRRAEAEMHGQPLPVLAREESTSLQIRTGIQLDLQECAVAAGLQMIRAQLRRAQQTADNIASLHLEHTDLVSLVCAIAEASEALHFVAAAVVTPGRQLLAAEAIHAQQVLTRLALMLAKYLRLEMLAALVAANRAMATGDADAAASAALRAQEAAGLTAWAARLGGFAPGHQLMAPGRAQDAASLHTALAAAAQLAESVLAGSPLDSGVGASCLLAAAVAADVDRPAHFVQLRKRARVEAA